MIEFRMQVARWLHLLGVVLWIGGMFFAYFALRPAAAALPPPQRLPLLADALRRFFGWVGIAIVAIVASGAWLVVRMGGSTAVGGGVQVMAALGIVMTLVFAYVVLSPYAALRRAVVRRRLAGRRRRDGDDPAPGRRQPGARRAYAVDRGVVEIGPLDADRHSARNQGW
jgi:uncharacterized membrane protein